MGMNSDQLDAFFTVAKTRSFSKAAQVLALSQPALSLRIKKLEESLKTSLLIRDAAGTELTEAGQKLFLHCKLRLDLERELMSDLGTTGSRKSLSGLIRIAGFSTVIKSVLIPGLSEMVVNYPDLQIDIMTKEVHELTNVLKRSEADFVISENAVVAGNVESILIGHEENILVESKNIRFAHQNVYFDNDSEDQTTFNFFRAQGTKPPIKFRRRFLDEVYSIVEAVEFGWGRAVLPKHLIVGNAKLRHLPNFRPLKIPVYLNYYRQPFYVESHQFVKARIEESFQEKLNIK